MSFFISEAFAEAPAAAAGAQQAAGWEGLIFPIGLVIILYFLKISRFLVSHLNQGTAGKINTQLQTLNCQ